MAPPKPQWNWKPQVELLAIGDILPEDRLVEIAELFAPLPVNRADLAEALYHLANDLNFALYCRGRPDSRNKRAAIGQLETPASKLKAMIEVLDTDSRAHLEKAFAAQEEADHGDEPPMRNYDVGAHRLRSLERRLAELLVCVEVSAKDLHAQEAGRPALVDERQAVRGIIALWGKFNKDVGRTLYPYTSKGKIQRIVDQLLVPVLAQHGLHATLSGVVNTEMQENGTG